MKVLTSGAERVLAIKEVADEVATYYGALTEKGVKPGDAVGICSMFSVQLMITKGLIPQSHDEIPGDEWQKPK